MLVIHQLECFKKKKKSLFYMILDFRVLDIRLNTVDIISQHTKN